MGMKKSQPRLLSKIEAEAEIRRLLLGGPNGFILVLIRTCGVFEALKIARRAARRCPDFKRRIAYARACLQPHWADQYQDHLDKSPNPYETMDDEDLRACDEDERREIRRIHLKRCRMEDELAVLKGDMLPFELLEARHGNERAARMISPLFDLFLMQGEGGLKRIRDIVLGAVRACPAYPETYINASVRNERAQRSRKKTQQKTRSGKAKRKGSTMS